MEFDLTRETRIEIFLRRHVWLLWLVTLLTSSALYYGVYICFAAFNKAHYWTIIPAGLLAHSFFVITMHDGAHQAITRTKFDYFIMNFCSGLIILPMYTELFKKYHLLHHDHTNTEFDPLWSPEKNKLFEEQRSLYAFLQCLPFAFNLAILLKSQKEKHLDGIEKPKISWWYVGLSFLVAGVIIGLARPSVWFVLGTFTVMTTLGAIRYWGEHMGVAKGKESNTHWFPLGMGIGNHEAHHHEPQYSWLTNTIGLLFRKMDTNPIKSVYGIFFDKRFAHYKSGKNKSA